MCVELVKVLILDYERQIRGRIVRVTVPPAALNKKTEDVGFQAPEPSAAAFSLLSRAQALADHLRAEVAAEVEALRAEATAAHDEARALLIDASSVHDDALSAQRSAQARLQEARQEAAQLVADAADQAALVANAANEATESLLANTHVEADELRNCAKAEDIRLRSLAGTELERVRDENAALRSAALAAIESQRSQVAAELEQLSRQATAHVSTIQAAAEKTCSETISAANAEADATAATAVRELDQARTQSAELRSTAAVEVASIRDAATAEAGRVLGDAAEHMAWTQDTVRSLLLTAEAEAVRWRVVSRASSAAHLAGRRREIQDVISRVALRVRATVIEASAEADRLRAQASAVLQAADRDSVATRNHAAAQAERVTAEADLTAQAGLERAQRRLDEAETGARVLRERAAAEVARLQNEAHKHRRAVRDEATSTLAAARADADTNRAQARDLLTHARAEVSVLARRRDDIAAQLGHLSGVIEALAVPEHRPLDIAPDTPEAGAAGPAVEHSSATVSLPINALTTNTTTGTR